ncbi:GspH/FimT family pseudopilin [Chitinimonas lacunae]|uniref:Type II secretion system protein H n=1 Tax=Chitinimonas lacunae TaxID=1963018 RepID=A0ABV8MXQ0_9NEIS
MSPSRAARPVRLLPAQAGFTLVELLTVLLLAAILAATVAPRINIRPTFEARGYADEAISAFRYARAAAIAMRRNVCVTISGGNLLQLRYAPTYGASAAVANCTANLGRPDGQSGAYSLSAATGVAIAPNQSVIFDSLGRPDLASALTVSISGDSGSLTRSFVVEAETGYVHE